MVRRLQALLTACLVAGAAGGEEEKEFDYKPPMVKKPLFDKELTMFEQERREYATNLAVYAASHVAEKGTGPDVLNHVRRVIALALHLDPRNRRALVVNFQLAKGVLPEAGKGNYNSRTLSRLLLSRARLLGERDRAGEKLLARCFTELAAVIDPRNEDAVYEFEIQRLDSGALDWRVITDAASAGEEGEPAGPAGPPPPGPPEAPAGEPPADPPVAPPNPEG